MQCAVGAVEAAARQCAVGAVETAAREYAVCIGAVEGAAVGAVRAWCVVGAVLREHDAVGAVLREYAAAGVVSVSMLWQEQIRASMSRWKQCCA
jgi:hypothetical protein